MKKITGIVTFLFIVLISANAQLTKTKEYFIKGTFNGLDSGTIRMLSRSGNVIMDSSMIVKGKFSMHGKISMPEQLLFNISPGNWNFLAFVEDTIITFSVDTTGAQHYGTKSSSDKWSLIWDIDETGSILSEVYKKFKSETHQEYYKLKITSLREELRTVDTNAITKDSLDKELDSLTVLAFSEQKDWIVSYINHNPSSVAGVFLFSQFYQSSRNMPLSYLEEILNKFSAPATSSVYFKELESIALNLKNSKPKNIVPDFTLLKRDKSKFRLSSTRGNYVLLDFWASWCIPCRKAIPYWKQVYSRYRQKGLIIASVSDDRNWNDWIKALDKEQMPWIQVIDEFPSANETAKVSHLFAVKALPFYILIDKEGNVILSSDAESLIKNKLEEIFK